MPISVGLAVGEHAITVRWCERDPSAADDRKLTFVYDPMAEVTVINASEICFELSGADRQLHGAAATSRATLRLNEKLLRQSSHTLHARSSG
jgi:hypothetical protein